MNTLYVALLRGINVGGHIVKMERLRAVFSELGFSNVRSYIQSGNVFFETSETEQTQLAARIENHLHQQLGYEVPVFLRTIPELEHLFALDSFGAREVTPDMRLAVTFTKDLLPQDLALPLFSPKRDLELVAVTQHEAFAIWHIIGGRPPSDAFLAKIIGKQTTTRFYHTLQKILTAAKQTG